VDERSVPLKKLAERVLGKGPDLPLALLLELVVPVRALRQLARELGLTPKGGFRIDRAPAHVLAALLAEQREPERLDAVLRLLLPAPDAPPPDRDGSADGDADDAAGAADALAELREAELARQRDELERSREGLARGREREAELARRLQQAEQEVVLLRRELAHRRPAEPRVDSARDGKDALRRVHELERECLAMRDADAELRRQLAEQQSHVRELEATVAELDALLPKGKRRKKPQPDPQPAPDRRFLLPRFLPSFYKSLEGKDRKAVERAIQAVLLFCTEGHAYPGLEVKQLGGQDTWSLRASLGLRVYFRPLPDGEIELLELGDREDQHTTLRRLKER
jgi:hypothetical protein